MGRIVGCLFDDSCLVVEFLRGNAPVSMVHEIEDGRDKRRDFSGDGITKDGEVFCVYSFND